MIARKKDVIDDADRVPGQAHPREVYDLIGQDAAVTIAAQAIRSGKPPQGWLISGPPGVGKATLAYRMARYLLRYGATAEGPEDLSVPPGDAVSRQIEAEAHPGLLVLKRRVNDKGKMSTVLSVEEIRRVVGFFGMTSGAGGWRVAIIDSADDMNDQAANALLKMLEEPPKRSILLVLSHAPGRLLPTIRSRCRRLDLRPLPQDVLETALAKLLSDSDARGRKALADVSEGSLGLALRLAGSEGLALAEQAEAMLETRRIDLPATLAQGDKISRIPDGLDHFGQFLNAALNRKIRMAAKDGHVLQKEIVLWEKIDNTFARATGLHMEPRQTLLETARAVTKIKTK